MTAKAPSAAQLRKNAEQRQQRKGLADAAPLLLQAAAALAQEDRHAEAATMLQTAVEREERRSGSTARTPHEVRRALAQALAASRQASAAISEYEEYLKAGTPDADALRALGDLYVAVGKPNLAVERLRRAIDRTVSDGDFKAAAAAADKVAKLMPDSIEAASQHAALLRRAGDPGLVQALERLADLNHANEKLAHEVAACREILELKPDRDDVRKRLASLYTRILEMDPHDEEAWQGLRDADPALSDQLTVLLMDELANRPRSKAG